MNVIYREHRADEDRVRRWANRIGFGDSTADAEIERSMALPGRFRPEHALVAEVDGEIAAQVTTLPFTMRWNGRDTN